MSCLGNDFSFGDIFARQVEALGQPGEVPAALRAHQFLIHAIIDGIEEALAPQKADTNSAPLQI